MATAASILVPMQPGKVFKVTGRQLFPFYLCPTTDRGKLSDATLPGGCYVAAGVDVFAVSPHALPFHASHTGEHGEVYGYFAAARMADRIQPAPGGCWVLCGKEKPYVHNGEAFGYRSRFAFYATRVEGDGMVMWAQTRWQMKEYRLNKNAAVFGRKMLEHPEANMDFVIRMVFAKPAAPLPPPAQGVGVRLPYSEARPVKAGLVAVRKDSTKTKPKPKPKPKPKKVVPPPIPPYARSEGGEALQQRGSGLPPPSARPPRPPKVVVANPVAPPPRPQIITKPVAPRPTLQVIAKPVAPPWTPQVIAKPVAPPPTPRVIAMPVAPPRPPQAIATAVAPPLSPRVIATPVVRPPLPARSSQDEATSSRAQPDNPNANMELVVRTAPAKNLPPTAAQTAAARASWVYKIPSGRYIIARYLGPKAIHGHLPRDATPGFVAEGVDVFAVSPDALPFPPSHRKQNGEVWGYFFAAKPTTSLRQAPGGCWKQYGREKEYCLPTQVIACHRRFLFHEARKDGGGKVAWVQTRWLMKEYRLNKAAPAAGKVQLGPGANMDLVVLKVFNKLRVPAPPPAWSGHAVYARCPRPVVPQRPPPAWSGHAEYAGCSRPVVPQRPPPAWSVHAEYAGCPRPVVPQRPPPPPQPPASTFDLPDMNS